MNFNLIIHLLILGYFYFIHSVDCKRDDVSLEALSASLIEYFANIPEHTNEIKIDHPVFEISIRNVKIFLSNINATIDEYNRAIYFNNIEVTYYFLLRIRHKEDDENLYIIREDCVAHQVFDNFGFTQVQDHSLIFSSMLIFNKFLIADLDLFHLEIYKHDFLPNDEQFQKTLRGIIHTEIEKKLSVYPTPDNEYYFKQLLKNLISHSYFSLSEIKSVIKTMRLTEPSYQIKEKQIINVKLRVWVALKTFTEIIYVEFETIDFQKQGFTLGEMKWSGSSEYSDIELKTAIYYCMNQIFKTIIWN